MFCSKAVGFCLLNRFFLKIKEQKAIKYATKLKIILND